MASRQTNWLKRPCGGGVASMPPYLRAHVAMAQSDWYCHQMPSGFMSEMQPHVSVASRPLREKMVPDLRAQGRGSSE